MSEAMTIYKPSVDASNKKNSNAVAEPHHFLFGAVTKCLCHQKEESHLYKGFCLVWLESQEGIREVKEGQKEFVRGHFSQNLYRKPWKKPKSSSGASRKTLLEIGFAAVEAPRCTVFSLYLTFKAIRRSPKANVAKLMLEGRSV
ncbi:hypothetical protein ES702_00954 [subsurface metagenome]